MTGVYDIYGFIIQADGPIVKELDKEFWRFKNTTNRSRAIDIKIQIKDSNEKVNYIITKPWGNKKGFYLPFGDQKRTILYEEGTTLSAIVSYLEMFLSWKDKTLLHAGAVADQQGAYVFTGSGGVGKTSSIINLIRNGYSYLGDDWLIVGNGQAFPFPKQYTYLITILMMEI
jgi:serine kinase of HPr protein (carbohydrate metabolism regulator)